MHLTIVSGTNRAESNTLHVAKLVGQLHREAGREVTLLDLQALPLDLLKPSAYGEKPVPFQSMVDAFMQSDGVVIVTPEYNGSFPGVLKLFIDMLPFPEAIASRPVSFVGLAAGRAGAMRSIEQLSQICNHLSALEYNTRVLLPGIGSLIGKDGGLVDKSLEERLRKQAEGFTAFAQMVKSL